VERDLRLSPGRRANRENFRSCRRTSLFLLLLFLQSMKMARLYLLLFAIECTPFTSS
jgi:hypothetical protein